MLLLYLPHLSHGALPFGLIFALSHSLPLLLPTARTMHLSLERVPLPILLLLTLLTHLTDHVLVGVFPDPPTIFQLVAIKFFMCLGLVLIKNS